jgi:hypothetical protein
MKKGEVCRWASPLLAARVRGPVASPRERRVQASRNESAMAAVAHKSLPTSNLPRRLVRATIGVPPSLFGPSEEMR